MKAVEATPGLLGFDINAPVTAAMAAAFVAHDFKFVARYLPRLTGHASDLSAPEVEILHAAGLAVMGVQHVESESSWVPNGEKGSAYGVAAGRAAVAAGLPLDTSLWCDLEGVDTAVPARDVIAYCEAWYDAVLAYGFTPGLYVGWHSGLTPPVLGALSFTRYWGAYNLNGDQHPTPRGLCMQQHACKCPVPGYEIDSDTIREDAFGGLPILCVPDTW